MTHGVRGAWCDSTTRAGGEAAAAADAEIEAEAQTYFASFDKDRSGTLSPQELEAALGDMGFGTAEIAEIIMKADEDGDGELSYNEFRKGVVPLLREKKGLGNPGEAMPKAKLLEIGHGIELCGTNPELDVKDDDGKDLGAHYCYVRQILSALVLFYMRQDLSEGIATKATKGYDLTKRVREEVVKLYPHLCGFGLDARSSVIKLVTVMSDRGVGGEEMLREASNKGDAPTDDTIAEEEQFSMGWQHFCAHYADKIKVSRLPGEALKHEIKDIASLYGSRKAFANGDFESLKQFMALLARDDCEALVRNAGVKIVRTILYMNPDQLSRSQQDVEYERLLNNEDPSAADKGDQGFRALQVEVARGGGVQVVVSCLSNKDPDTVVGALRLANTLLAGSNPLVQDLFYAQLSPASSQSFFLRLRDIIHDSINAIKEAKRKAKQQAAEREAMRRAGVKTAAPGPSDSGSGDYGAMMTAVMQFMRRSYLGQHKNMQDVLRVQRVNRETFNFFHEAVHYLTALEPDLRGAIATGDKQIAEAAIRGFLMLSDAMKGPNYENQKSIATSGILDLADRIFNKIKLEQSLPGKQANKKRKARPAKKAGQVAPAEDEEESDDDDVPHVDIYWQNKMRCRLKSALLECLGSFLEGVVEDSIPMQMLSTCNWIGYAAQMSDCFQMRHRADIAPVTAPASGPPENIVSEGLSYYFLMKFLEKYQASMDEKPVDEALKLHTAAVRFFEARKGYVEITRDGRLERLFFRLPDACMEGGVLDKPYESLYDTSDREDADKKTKDFLENMARLVKEEALLDRIRASVFAWTVNGWDSIKMLTFYWGLLLHLMLIFGSYAPHSSLPFAGSETSYDSFQAASDEAGAASFTRFFLVTVLPFVDSAAIYMCYVNGGLCALRYFAFLWAQIPVIIINGLSAIEEEEEEEEANAVPWVSSADDEDEVEILFIDEASDSSALSREIKEEEEDGVGGGAGRVGILTHMGIVLGSAFFLYETFFVGMAALAILLDEPLCTAVFCLEVRFWREARALASGPCMLHVVSSTRHGCTLFQIEAALCFK